MKKRILFKRKGLFFATKSYLINFLNVLPGVNPGALRAANVIRSPVLGFLPTRAFLLLTLNVPNPVSTTFSPRFNESRMVFKVVWTASREALLVRFAFLATTSIRSFFVKQIGLFSGGLFPLDVLPKSIFSFLTFLPFSYLTYFPARIYLGKVSVPDLLLGFIILLLWIVIFYIIVQIVWLRGLKAYTAQGR